jgi:predicted dehydrogenase
MSRNDLRVAVIGLGKMGLVHSSVLNVLPSVRIVALCEKSFVTRKLLGKLFSRVRIVDDVKKLVDLDLDAVYVTTPIPSHFAIANTLYSSKIARNLFIEKTLARTYEEAKKLCELAQTFGDVSMVGYLRRYYVTFKKAKDLLSKKAIGAVSSFRAYAYSSDFLDVKGSNASISRGGVLRDLGCYAVDLALWFFGGMEVCPAEPKSTVANNPEDFVAFRVRNSKGLEGKFDVSWYMKNYRMPEVGFRIVGSEGIIEVNDDKVRLETGKNGSIQWYRHDLNDNVDFWLGLPEYYREDLHFIKSVREHHPAEPDFQAASSVDEILGDVERRADSN